MHYGFRAKHSTFHSKVYTFLFPVQNNPIIPHLLAALCVCHHRYMNIYVGLLSLVKYFFLQRWNQDMYYWKPDIRITRSNIFLFDVRYVLIGPQKLCLYTIIRVLYTPSHAKTPHYIIVIYMYYDFMEILKVVTKPQYKKVPLLFVKFELY